MPGIVPGTPKCATIDDLLLPHQIFLNLLDLAPEPIFLRVTKQLLPGWWMAMKGIIGMTKFTRFGLTINNTIGKFSGGGLGND